MSQNNSKTLFLTISDPRSSTIKSVSDCHLSFGGGIGHRSDNANAQTDVHICRSHVV